MQNLFKVEGQTLTPIEIYPAVSDTVNYLTFGFTFDSEWDGLTKSAIFTKGASVYEVVLTDDEVLETDHVNLSAGVWSIAVVGDTVVDAVVTRQITTSSYNYTVAQSGATSGGVFPPSIASQVYLNVNQATPQTLVGGIFKLAADRVIDHDNEVVDKKFVDDAISGAVVPIPAHNDLTSLQGGMTDEYYHMTSAQNTILGNTSGTNTGDQDVSGAISTHNTDGGAHSAQFTDVYEKQTAPHTVVLFGDSITKQNSDMAGESAYNGTLAHAQTLASGWFSIANILMRHKFKVVFNAGVSGNTTTSMLARIQTDVISKDAAWVVVHGGVNDIVGSSIDGTTVIANLKSIYEQIIASGKRVIALTILPCNAFTTAANKAAFNKVNRWIKEYAWSNNGVICVDWHTVVADPATGGFLATMSTDGTHPNQHGAAILGQYLATKLDDLVSDIDLLQNNITDIDSLISNGFMTGDSAGLATGWAIGGPTTATLTKSKVARTDGIAGEWQQLAVTSAGNVYFSRSAVNIAGIAAVGDNIYAQMEFETDDDFVGLAGFQMYINLMNVSSATVGLMGDNVPSGAGTPDVRLSSGILRTPDMLIPAGTTNFQIIFKAIFSGAGAQGTFRLSRAEVRKVTY